MNTKYKVFNNNGALMAVTKDLNKANKLAKTLRGYVK